MTSRLERGGLKKYRQWRGFLNQRQWRSRRGVEKLEVADDELRVLQRSRIHAEESMSAQATNGSGIRPANTVEVDKGWKR